MSSAGRRVRSRRSAPVVVTHAGTRAGQAIVAALVAGEGSLPGHQVTAVGTPPLGSLDPEDSVDPRDVIDMTDDDLTAPTIADRIRGAAAVVHVLAPDDLAAELGESDRRERLVREVQTLALAAAATGVPHLILVTSAMVYGAHEDSQVPLDEDAPRRADRTTGLVGDLVEVEDAFARVGDVHPALRTTVVRPATLVDGTDTIMTRHFAAPRLLRLKESEPAWQLCHVEDLGRALVYVVAGGLGPVVTVGAEGWLVQDEVEQLSGMRPVELSQSAAMGIAHRLHRIGSLPAPATDLAYIAHPWVVSSATLRAQGWRAAYDNATCLQILLDDARAHRMGAARRFDRKDGAALGAASAAVAVGATAAIMRRRRQKGST